MSSLYQKIVAVPQSPWRVFNHFNVRASNSRWLSGDGLWQKEKEEVLGEMSAERGL